ncbi:sigma-54 interaction domain-containing protein [Pendulispora albinea]|uniref:Sigma-54 dependent transcriptional regulator n=1 Tax=Pendulispora albinea TaxID=2741071 RepID=A0ABZ2M4M2_9BACT
MSSSSSTSMALLTDLVEALGFRHTERTWARATYEVLSRYVAVRTVEIVLFGPAGSRKILPSATTSAVVALRPSEESWFRDAMLRGARLLDTKRAAAMAIVPIADSGGALGCATIALERESELLTRALLESMGRVLRSTLRQIHAIARVAELSRRVHTQTRQLREDLRQLLPSAVVAANPRMQRIFAEIVPLVARQDTTVLICGESGTGKEVVARRIHELSPRSKRPFIRINCGAIPSGLVESTLFGHEKGAFTGATERRAGVFERAHMGTLLLDEVGELPPSAQVKLLRVIETGEAERVGGNRTIPLDVRILAATHRDLHAMVDAQAFRADLLYRLDVFPITIPPLRERKDELEALTAHILARLARRFGRSSPPLSRKSIARLRSYEWPGNVRELENVLERSLLLSTGASLEIVLPDRALKRGSVSTFQAAAKRCIEDALALTEGRIYGPNGAAAVLGIKPTTLQSKMKRLGMARRAIAR